MYIYCDKEIKNPLYIHFLCGNKYSPDKTTDKRNVLKEYIDSLDNNYALILEKLFEPSEYTPMGFKDLEEVELMASHYAKSIIILHETVSTAAEIALFGSKDILKNKILVIYAPPEITETDSVGAFIRLAYFNNDKVSNSSYNFNRRLNKISGKNIAYYKLFFPKNKIDSDFKQDLNDFWSKTSNVLNISLTKKNVKYYKDNTYDIEENLKSIYVNINYNLILSILICILLNNELIKDKRNIDFVVQKVCLFFKELIKNTISNNEYKNIDNYSISIKTIDNKDINIPIKFCLYILNKSELISIKDNEIVVSHNFKEKCNEYKGLIKNIEEPDFFEGVNHE